MDNEIPTGRHATDEIDLLELFNRMGRSIVRVTLWMLEQVKRFIILLIRKSLWIAFFGITGLVIAYLLYTNSQRYYASEMTAISNSVNSTYIVNSVNLLNDLFKENNNKIASEYLQLNIEETNKIKSIQAYFGIDVNHDKIPDYIDYENDYNPKDTSIKRLPDYFYVRIEVFDEGIFPKVRDGIINYINRNPFVISNNNERIRQNNILINAIELEIRKLDSLQKLEYFELPQIEKSRNGSMVVLNEKDRKLYDNRIINLKKDKLDLEEENRLYRDPITVIQDFTPLSKAENPYMRYAKFWGIIFALLGFVLSLVWQNRKWIIKQIFEKQY